MSDFTPACESPAADPPADPAGAPGDASRAREARRHAALQAVFGASFGRTFVSPFMVIEDHVIACPVAIRFYRKDFAYVSRQLHAEYQYRAWRGFEQALLERYAGIVRAKLTALDALMQNNINRLRKLLAQQGYEADLSLWPNALVTDVPVIASHARAYLDVLANLDRVYTLSGTANLLGVLDSTQRAEIEVACKKAVRAFRSVLQSEVAALYAEAERVMAKPRKEDATVPASPGTPGIAITLLEGGPPRAEDEGGAGLQAEHAPAAAAAAVAAVAAA